FLNTGFFYQNLDTRLVFVVATAFAVVHTQNGVQITQQMFFWQETADFATNNRGAAEATTDQYFKTSFTLFVAYQVQANIVNLGSCLVTTGAADCNLELARQEGKFRVEC